MPPLAVAVNHPGPGPLASGDSCSDQVTWGLRQQAGQAAGSLPPVAQRSGTTAMDAATLGRQWPKVAAIIAVAAASLGPPGCICLHGSVVTC